MKPVFRILLVLVLLAAPLLACSISSSLSNTEIVEVIANPAVEAWLQAAAADFNDSRMKTTGGQLIQVTVRSQEAGQTVTDLVAGGGAPDLWVPDDPVWTAILAEKGNAAFQEDCLSVVQSPLVIAIWRPAAEALGWPGRSLGWLDVGSLAADPSAWKYYSGGQFGESLRLSHTNPGLAHSGASTLLAVVQAALSKSEPVTPDEIDQPIVRASVSAFEGAVASFGTDTNLLGQVMRQRGVTYLGAAVVYESTVLRFADGDPQIVPIYPFEGTFVATHPVCLDTAGDDATQAAARAFRDYLGGEQAQKMAVAHGLRPTYAGIPLTSPLDAAHGVDMSQPKVVFPSPSPASLYAVQALWQLARKQVNLVMIIDTSGSMQGDKIEGVRRAATQFVEQMGDQDYLSLITYSAAKPVTALEHVQVGPNREHIYGVVQSLAARGSTPLYDSIGAAAELVAGHLSPQTTNVIVLLSDGLDTASKEYTFGDRLFETAAAHDTVIFTIAYGEDADQKMLAELAQRANGSFYLGSEANIAAIYQEMSAAFGGSVGIGR